MFVCYIVEKREKVSHISQKLYESFVNCYEFLIQNNVEVKILCESNQKVESPMILFFSDLWNLLGK